MDAQPNKVSSATLISDSLLRVPANQVYPNTPLDTIPTPIAFNLSFVCFLTSKNLLSL